MRSKRNAEAAEKIQTTLAEYHDRLYAVHECTAQQLPEDLMILPAGHLRKDRLVRHVMYLCQKGSQLALEGDILEAARILGVAQGYMFFADYVTVAGVERDVRL